MDTITKVLKIFIGSTHAHLQGKNARLYWNDELEGFTGEITEHNKSIVCAGWNVIIWKGKKPISVYFGQDFDYALDAFEKQENEE